MKKQKGFTLIELLLVIMILGILSVTAAPKFLNLGSDTHASTIKHIKGTIKSASDLIYAKSILNGVPGGSGTLTIGGETIHTYKGYPKSDSTNVLKFTKLDPNELKITPHNIETGGFVTIIQPLGHPTPASDNPHDFECAVIYSLDVFIPPGTPTTYTQHMDKC